MTAVVSLDAVAVRAPYLAVGDLGLRLSDALAVAYVACLDIADVVEVERNGACLVATVDTADRQLVVVQPSSNGGCAFVGPSIDGLAVAGACEPSLTPRLRLLRVVRPRATAAISARIRAVAGAVSLGRESHIAAHTCALGCGDRFPRRHVPIIPGAHVVYPCKPNIFEATYEVVE